MRNMLHETAALLDQAEQSRMPLPPLSQEYPTLTPAQAYAIQSAWLNLKLARGARLIGRKIGLTSRAMQELLGVDQPDYGFLLDSMAVSSGSTLSRTGFLLPRIEPEIAFWLAKDLKGSGITVDAVLQTCENVGAAIFVHPATVLAPERTSKYRMFYSVGYTTETGMAAAAIVMSGLLDQHPKLRICFAHGGGIFPWLLPRLDQTWNVFDDVKAGTARKPSETAKMLTYDTLTYDINNLGLLIERVGVDRLVMGTDYPFPLREVPPGVVIDAVHNMHSEEREAMLGQNALRFLGRSSTSTITSS